MRYKRNIMWQRTQSIFLFIALILNVAIFWLDLANISLDGVLHSFNLYKLQVVDSGEVVYSNIALATLCSLCIALCLITLGMFKKRQLQIKLAKLLLLVQVGFLVAIFFIVDGAVTNLTSVSLATVEYYIGAYFALLPMIFIFLAIKAIKKDEDLVRAADRIR
ncbi:MAG: hypothetical protein ACI91R_000864 [Vicingaceae bacterium]